MIATLKRLFYKNQAMVQIAVIALLPTIPPFHHPYTIVAFL